jgi:hypothetical protein
MHFSSAKDYRRFTEMWTWSTAKGVNWENGGDKARDLQDNIIAVRGIYYNNNTTYLKKLNATYVGY